MEKILCIGVDGLTALLFQASIMQSHSSATFIGDPALVIQRELDWRTPDLRLARSLAKLAMAKVMSLW